MTITPERAEESFADLVHDCVVGIADLQMMNAPRDVVGEEIEKIVAAHDAAVAAVHKRAEEAERIISRLFRREHDHQESVNHGVACAACGGTEWVCDEAYAEMLVGYERTIDGQATAIREKDHALAECFRLSGADPDGNEDWRLAPRAVDEVRTMRRRLDEAEAAQSELRSALQDALTREQEATHEAHEARRAISDLQSRELSEERRQRLAEDVTRYCENRFTDEDGDATFQSIVDGVEEFISDATLSARGRR